MNIFRGIVASILIIIFSLATLVIIVGFGLERTIVPQTATMIIEKARAGERVTTALPGFMKERLPGPVAQLPREDINKFVAEALSADQVNALLKPFSGEVVEYIRGERETVTKIDLVPIEKRAEAAAKKILPGMVGVQFAAMIQVQFKTAGLDKGFEIPQDQLGAARTAFSQFRLGAEIALAAVLILFVLIFAVAPHGLAGRLRWSGAALIVAGCLSAVVAACIFAARAFILGLAFNGNAPPEIKDLLKDAVGVFAEILAKNVFVAAAVCVGIGVALIILNYFLPKQAVLDEAVVEPKI